MSCAPRFRPLLVLALLAVTGCQEEIPFDGPTVENFDGQLVGAGAPLRFSNDEEVQLLLIHKGSAERFYIPINADGSFDIGWMPIGDYLCSIGRKEKTAGVPAQAPMDFKQVPGGFRIEAGKTEYEIEVGKDF